MIDRWYPLLDETGTHTHNQWKSSSSTPSLWRWFVYIRKVRRMFVKSVRSVLCKRSLRKFDDAHVLCMCFHKLISRSRRSNWSSENKKSFLLIQITFFNWNDHFMTEIFNAQSCTERKCRWSNACWLIKVNLWVISKNEMILAYLYFVVVPCEIVLHKVWASFTNEVELINKCF